jgi:hypothetical protein
MRDEQQPGDARRHEWHFATTSASAEIPTR